MKEEKEMSEELKKFLEDLKAAKGIKCATPAMDNFNKRSLYDDDDRAKRGLRRCEE